MAEFSAGESIRLILAGMQASYGGLLISATLKEKDGGDFTISDFLLDMAWQAAFALLPIGIAVVNRSASKLLPLLKVSSGMGSDVRPMSVLRIIQKGERTSEIINEAKVLTSNTSYGLDQEVALVRLSSGQRALVTGGHDGIYFEANQITRIYGHTHPYGYDYTGHSSADREALVLLNQKSSYLLDNGVIEKFYR